jgi:acyl dehydratase
MFDDIPVVNNLKFKNVVFRECMGKLYAFVTCVDVQSNGKGTGLKAYWGEVYDRNSADDITNVMLHGAKWEALPPCPF